MLVTVKYIRNGLNTTKDLKNTKRPHLMKRSKNPLGGASQRNGRKPKMPLAAKRFECKTPFEFDIAFAVFIPIRGCVWPFGVYIPFRPLWPPISLLVLMYMHPFMGFQRTCTCIPLWDFWPFRKRVKPYGVFMWVTPFGIFRSVRSDGHLLRFGDHSRRLDHYVCVFDRLSIYLFIYLFFYSLIYL